MRRNLWRLGLVGMAGVAAGCNRQAVQPAAATPPLLGSVLGKQPSGFTPQAPAEAPAVARDARKPAAPLRPDTEVALADNELQAVYLEQVDQTGFGAAVGVPGGPRPEFDADDRNRAISAALDREAAPKFTPAERDRLIDAARQRYQRALAADPAHKGALVGLGRLYAWTGDKERAVATLRDAAGRHPQDHELAHKLAGVQVQFGDFAGAEGACRQALGHEPENRVYKKTLGLALGHQGKWQEAGEALLAAGMAEADAHYFLARVRLDRGDADGGRKQLQLALGANPQHAAARQVASQLDAGGRPADQLPPAANPVMAAGHAEPQR